MFLVLEGIDCSGKTTAVDLLAKQRGMVPYATPPATFRKERNRVDAESSPRDHYLFYLEGIRQASIEIRDLLAAGVSVACDRYWLTTYVYHTVMGLDVDLNDFSSFLMPDLTVLLSVSPDVQAERFLRRGLSAGDRRMINMQSQLDREFQAAIERLGLRSSSIDTDHLTPQEVVQKIIAELP